MPLLSLVVFFSRAQTDGARATRIPTVVLRPSTDEPSPDIYYIILDGYARSDYMTEAIGLDNSEFIAFLERQGLLVAKESRSNHNWTSLSLASSLNMTLAQYLGANMLPGYYPTPFVDFIRHNLVRRSLEEIGYRTVAVQSDRLPSHRIGLTPMSTLAQPPIACHRRRKGFQPNAFESMLLDTTLLQPVLSWPPIGFELKGIPTRESRATLTMSCERSSFRNSITWPSRSPWKAPVLSLPTSSLPTGRTSSPPPVKPATRMSLSHSIESVDVSSNDKDLYRDQAAYITGQRTTGHPVHPEQLAHSSSHHPPG